VTAHAHQIDVHAVDIDGNFPESLRRIRMEENSSGTAHFTDRLNVLDDSDLVVNCHGRAAEYLLWLVGQHLLEVLQVNQPRRKHRKVRNPKSLAFQAAAGVEHALVLGLHCNDMAFLSNFAGTCLP